MKTSRYILRVLVGLIGVVSLLHLTACGRRDNADTIPLELAGWYARAALVSPYVAQDQLASVIEGHHHEWATLPANEWARPHARLADYFLWTGAYSESLAERRESLRIIGNTDPWMEGHLVYLAAMSRDVAVIASVQDEAVSDHGKALARAVRALIGGDAGDLTHLLARDELRPEHAIWANAIMAEHAEIIERRDGRDIGEALEKIESHLSIEVSEWGVESKWYLIYRSLTLGTKRYAPDVQRETAKLILRYMEYTPAAARDQAQQEVEALLNAVEQTPLVSWQEQKG